MQKQTIHKICQNLQSMPKEAMSQRKRPACLLLPFLFLQKKKGGDVAQDLASRTIWKCTDTNSLALFTFSHVYLDQKAKPRNKRERNALQREHLVLKLAATQTAIVHFLRIHTRQVTHCACMRGAGESFIQFSHLIKIKLKQLENECTPLNLASVFSMFLLLFRPHLSH